MSSVTQLFTFPETVDFIFLKLYDYKENAHSFSVVSC